MLKAFLLDCYKSSTFNAYKHQPLPLTEGPPPQLMVDPEAESAAYLFQSPKVKKGLDQDVLLGILKPVPVGWYHSQR